MTKPLAIGLFAGAGGMSLGFKMVGYRVLLAYDTDLDAKRTYLENNPEVQFSKASVAHISLDGIKRKLKKCEGEPTLKDIDVVFGGPPCQGFSIIGPGRKNGGDHRNECVKYFIKAVRMIQPKAFVMENVPGLLSLQNGFWKALILRAFEKAGYNVTPPEILDAQNYGVPQRRKRVIFIGVRKDLKDWPAPYPAEDPWGLTVWDAISDLPANPVSHGLTTHYLPPANTQLNDFQKLMREQGGNEVYNHHTKGWQATREARIKILKAGQNRLSLPAELQSKGLANKYRRLDSLWAVAPTITAHMGKDLSDFIHPRYNRWITIREAARFQSFPDWYKFEGSISSQLKQVGNAMPPIFAAHVAYHIGIYLGLDVKCWTQK